MSLFLTPYIIKGKIHHVRNVPVMIDSAQADSYEIDSKAC